MVMPNSRERFEAEFTRTWPEYVRLTPDVFNRVGDGAYVDGTIHVAFVMWQAGAAAERERVNMPCTHENGYAKWDHWACRDCGAVKPDGVREGRPNNGWFPSMESFSAWKNGDRGIT